MNFLIPNTKVDNKVKAKGICLLKKVILLLSDPELHLTLNQC